MASFSPADVRASICRESFEDFVRHFWNEVPGAGKCKWNWHLSVFCQELQIVAERVFKGLPKLYDLVINVSPGTSKSTIISILFPTWIWTRFPEGRVLSASHTDSLVLDLSTKARSVILSDKYCETFPEVELRHDQDTKGYYANTRGGDRYTCTVAGKSPMGFHAHFLIIDDPIDPKKALSEAETKTAKEFVTEVVSNRKVDKLVTPTILVMQRLGVGDPTDVMLDEGKKEGASPVRHICLPAELTRGDDGAFIESDVVPQELARRYVNGLMDPVRMPAQVLNENKARGALFYATQFLQRPYSRSGGMFMESYFLHTVKAAPYKAKRVRFWDNACLVAGTMIETSSGSVPIEKVRVGDFVLTRFGYKKVTWSGETKRTDDLVSVRLPSGRTLTGTPEHLVWTENKGWICLESVCDSDYFVMCNISNKELLSWSEKQEKQNTRPKASFTKASRINGELASDIIRRGCTTRTKKNGGVILCTEQCGESTTDLFQTNTISITSMTIGTITTSVTSNVLRRRNIVGGIGTRCEERLSRCVQREKRCQFGLRRIGEPRSTRSNVNVEARSLGIGQYIGNMFVSFAGIRFCPELTNLRQYALAHAEISTLKRKRLRSRVNNAGKNSLRLGDHRVVHCPVLENYDGQDCQATSEKRRCVRRMKLRESVPVYDLTVEDVHEFFADGILVHNSTQAGGCNTAGVLMSRDGNEDYFVEHVVKGQWEPDERNKRILFAAQQDRRRYGPNNEPTIWVEQEPGSAGVDAFKYLAKVLRGYPIRAWKPTGKKEIRARPWSSQLAAGNVHLVTDGTWDVDGFIKEHLAFPLGAFKDQVDAAAAAFSLLLKAESSYGMRTFAVNKRKDGQIQFLVLDQDELLNTRVEERSLLVSIGDPMGPDDVPGHALTNLLGSLRLRFTAHEPSDHQENYGEIIEPYGQSVVDLVLQRSQAKRLWAFLLQKRDPKPEIIVIQDEGTGVALTLAQAISDCLSLPRTTIVIGDDPEQSAKGEPLSRHIFDTVKVMRGAVI